MLRACAWRAGKFGECDTLMPKCPSRGTPARSGVWGGSPIQPGGLGGWRPPRGRRGACPPPSVGEAHAPGGSGGLEAPQGGAGGGSPRIPRDKQTIHSGIAFMNQARHDVFAVVNNHGQLTLSHQLRVPWNIQAATACTSAVKFQNIAFQCD